MTKFNIDDIVILSVDPFYVTGTDEPYYIDEPIWDIVKGKYCRVTENVGSITYNGYTSRNAIILDCENDNLGGCYFPEEWFELYRPILFQDNTDFLI